MRLDNVLYDLIHSLESGTGQTLGWDQIREWPKGALDLFQETGWIKPKADAVSVVCPGCEENCFMPVNSRKYPTGSQALFVDCDRRDDMGRIPITPELLQQWQITGNQVAKWIGHALSIRGRP